MLSAWRSASRDHGAVLNRNSPALDAEGEFDNEIPTPDNSPMPPSRNMNKMKVSFAKGRAQSKMISNVTKMGISEYRKL